MTRERKLPAEPRPFMARQSCLGPDRERQPAGVKLIQVRRGPAFLNVTPDSLAPLREWQKSRSQNGFLSLIL